MSFTFDTYKTFVIQYDKLLTERDWLARGRKLLPPELKRQLYLDDPAMYRANLPTYTLAICPICGGRVSEAIDTFSLRGLGWWFDEPLGFGWFGRKKYNENYLAPKQYTEVSYQATCHCVQAVVYGVNLNGILPNDVRVDHVVIGSERPGVLRPFMEQAGSYAVMCALPVGRFDDEVWQPRYTVYFVTYFNSVPAIYRAALAPQDPTNPEFVWPYSQLDYELKPWVDAGKLFWLNQDLQLVKELPPDNLTAEGLMGRWRIKYGRLALIPEEFSDAEALGGSGPAWQQAESLTMQALKERQLKPLVKN